MSDILKYCMFLQLCKFKPSLFSKPVNAWDDDENYQYSKLVNGFTPLNDAAERAVMFGSDFSGAITHDVKRKDVVLQVVEQHRHMHPKATKF